MCIITRSVGELCENAYFHKFAFCGTCLQNEVKSKHESPEHCSCYTLAGK